MVSGAPVTCEEESVDSSVFDKDSIVSGPNPIQLLENNLVEVQIELQNFDEQAYY